MAGSLPNTEEQIWSEELIIPPLFPSHLSASGPCFVVSPLHSFLGRVTPAGKGKVCGWYIQLKIILVLELLSH